MPPIANRIQRFLSMVAFLAGITTSVLFALWPSFVQSALGSLTWTPLLATWFFIVAACAHPEFRRRLAKGIREFHRSFDDLF